MSSVGIRPWRVAGLLVLSASVLVPLAVDARAATTITVDTFTDNADGDCSLREAIIASNTDAPADACPAGSGDDTIQLPAGTYTLSLAGGEDVAIGSDAATGDLDITESVTITGAGSATTIIDGGDIDRVLHLPSGTTVNITGVTIRNGTTTDHGGGLRQDGGTLDLEDVVVTSNNANLGGGIFLTTLGTLNIAGSTVSNNSGNYGGGILLSGNVNLDQSTISGNSATGFGGGILSSGTISVTNSTVSGNTGGGIWTDIPSGATLTHTTVTDNSGGGIIYMNNPLFAPTVSDSIIAGHGGDADCNIPMNPVGPNLDSDGTCLVSLTVPNPLLGPLSFSGGPTETHALQPGSPAIDAASVGGCPAIDQRGATRIAASCDLGAYEVTPMTFIPTRTDDPLTPDGCFPTDCSLREAVIAANQDSAADTIDISAGTYSVEGASGEGAALTGDLDITSDVDIEGANATNTFIDGDVDRVLDVSGAATEATISDVTIQNGNAPGDGGGIRVVDAALTVTDSAVTGSVAVEGGGIANLGGKLSLNGSTVSGNAAGDYGGGVHVTGPGAEYDFVNTTISGNTALDGGGVSSELEALGSGALVNVTITDNTSGGNPGMFVDDTLGGPLPSATNTIVADNNGSEECSTPIDSVGPNLDSDLTCFNGTGDVHDDPELGSLGNNGGSTQTHALLQDSPAIDAGVFGSGVPTEDQRGQARVDGDPGLPSDIDIGAYEANALSIDDVSAVEGGDFIFTVSLAVADPLTVEVSFETADGTAIEPDDYTGESDTLTFTPGDLTESITVTTIDDASDEPDENLLVELTDATVAVIADDQGVGTITDNGAAPTPDPTPTPTPTPTPPTADCPSDDAESVCATDGDDDVVVDASDDADGDGEVNVYLGDGADSLCIEITAGLTVTVYGGDGNDSVTVGDCGSGASVLGVPVSVSSVEFWGGPGDDSASGSSGPDRLDGGNGRDVLQGRRGRDRLRGGRGRDVLMGGPGQDSCHGGPGQDTMSSCSP